MLMKKKTLSERIHDASGLRLQIDTWLGQADLKISDIPELAEFVKDSNMFIREGISVTNTVRINELKRLCTYRLSVQPHIKSSMDMLFRPKLFDKLDVTDLLDSLEALEESKK